MNKPPKKQFSSLAAPLAAAGALILSLALAYLFLSPKSYTASARIKVADWSNGAQQPNPLDTRYIKEECALLRSNSVLDNVITNLGLMQVWGEKSSPKKILTLPQAREQLLSQILIHPVQDLSLIEIRVVSPVQSEPAAIANELARCYFSARLEHHRAVIGYQMQTLDKDYQDKDQTVREAQTNVDALYESVTRRRATNTVKYYEPESYGLLVRKKIDLESQYIQQQDEFARLRAMSRPDLTQTLSTVETNSTLMPVLLKLNAARNKLFAARLDHGPASQEVAQANAEVEELLRKSDELTTTIMEAKEINLKALKASLDSWASRLRNASTNLNEALVADKDYNDAVARLKKAKEEREAAQFKIDVVHMNEKLLPSSEKLTAEVIDQAEEPTSPHLPDQTLGVCAASIGGIFLLLGCIARLSKPKKISSPEKSG